jgi:hypothetical protein
MDGIDLTALRGRPLRTPVTNAARRGRWACATAMACALACGSPQASEENPVDTPLGRPGQSGTASPAPVRIDFPERLHIVNDDRAAPPPHNDVEPIRIF